MTRRSKRNRWSLRMLAAVSLLFFCAGKLKAQSIHVDATPSHAVNTIRPREALGAGIDRLPYGAADKLFADDNIRNSTPKRGIGTRRVLGVILRARDTSPAARRRVQR
jgi:hypothetical protein